MHFVMLTELGILVLENEKPVKSFPFNQPAAEFINLRAGVIGSKAIVDFLRKLNLGVGVNEEPLLKILKKEGIESQLMSESEIEKIQSSKLAIMIEAGLAKNQGELMAKLRDFALQLSSAKVTEISQSPDLHIIQGIKALDEIDVMMNGLSSRLREWYGLHFPELDNIIDSINGYAQIVMAGKREELSKKVYEDAGFPESKVEMLSIIQGKSRGGDISKENMTIVQAIARQILDMTKVRKEIETHVENEMKVIAPNLGAILGTAVGARILSKAGSLKKLASMPASTIQIMGAEKALFRALKTGTAPPKHGILFQHPIVHAAPRWQRGKMARAIAAKAAIAARVDMYGAGLNQTLLEKLNVRVTEIGDKYKEPVERPAQQQYQRFDDRPRGGYGSRGPRRDFRGGGGGRDRKPGGGGGRGDRDFRSGGNKRKRFGKRN